MKITRLCLTVAAVAGALVTQSTVTLAEPMDDILVTAERREASLQDVPLAVSAFDMEKIGDLQISEARDLQRYAPSLNMFNNITTPTNLSLSLRGGLQQDASLIVAESPVGIYVDDIYLGRLNGNNVRLSDIERIEVLRGPQGTLYGRNTGYGAIKFISRTPGDDFWLDGTAGVGNYDQLLFKGSTGGPIGAGFFGSLSGMWSEKEGQYKNIATGQDTDEQETYTVRGKLRWSNNDNLDVILTASQSDTETDSLQLVNAITPGVPDDQQFTTDDLVFPNGEFRTNTDVSIAAPAPPQKPGGPQGDTEQTILGLTITWDIFDNITLKSITGFVNTEDFWQTDFSGNTAAAPGFYAASDSDTDQFTQELQVIGSAMDDRLNYIGGIFFMNEDGDQLFGWNFVSPLSRSLNDIETDSIAVFGEASYQFTDKLKGTLGLRWTEDDKDFQFDFERFAGNFFDAVVAPGFFPPTMETLNFSEDYDEWTPRIGIDYQLDPFGVIDSMLLYAQYAEGFKSGGFSAIALASTFPVGAYFPETNDTYEFGIKAEWFENRLRTNLAYFFSDIENIQQNATDVTSPSFEFPVQNSGDAEIYGVEFEIAVAPFDGLDVFLNGALLSGEYENLNPTSAAAAVPTLFNAQPETPQTPDYTISLGFDYTVPWSNDVFDEIRIGGDYYEIDEYLTAATNDFRNAGWDQTNAYITALFMDESLEARLACKNCGDATNVTSGSRGLGGFILMAPREVLFTVTYRLPQ